MTAQITLYLGAAGVMAAVVVLGSVVLSGTGKTTGPGATDLRQVVLRQRARKRLLGPVISRLADGLHALTPTGALERLDHKIDVAGARATWTVDRLLGTKVLLASLGGLFAVYRVLNDPTITNVLMAFLLTAGAFALPDLVLSRRASERQAQIERELPDLLDLPVRG